MTRSTTDLLYLLLSTLFWGNPIWVTWHALVAILAIRIDFCDDFASVCHVRLYSSKLFIEKLCNDLACCENSGFPWIWSKEGGWSEDLYRRLPLPHHGSANLLTESSERMMTSCHVYIFYEELWGEKSNMQHWCKVILGIDSDSEISD